MFSLGGGPFQFGHRITRDTSSLGRAAEESDEYDADDGWLLAVDVGCVARASYNNNNNNNNQLNIKADERWAWLVSMVSPLLGSIWVMSNVAPRLNNVSHHC